MNFMKSVSLADLNLIKQPAQDSHKGQNGRLLVIGGSHLFHAASLWALTVASRIVDLVHYASVAENNEIVQKAKEEFRNGMVVSRDDVDAYIEEDDVVLIGPGMVRDPETESITNTLLKKYPEKQWVIDAGALQMMDITLIPRNAILTPHHGEFELLWSKGQETWDKKQVPKDATLEDKVRLFATQYHCIVLVKGEKDIACSGGDCDEKICVPGECREISGGNVGMTKGGTGDVLAGLIAALACKNDPFLATIAGSFINKRAGDALYKKVGPYFNATDLASQIPETMKETLLYY
jgi:NAD(P)H-hydrate epimerase